MLGISKTRVHSGVELSKNKEKKLFLHCSLLAIAFKNHTWVKLVVLEKLWVLVRGVDFFPISHNA